MADLVQQTPEAAAWVEQQIRAHYRRAIYDRIGYGILWVGDDLDSDGLPIVDIDSADLVEDINTNGQRLLNGHDPGRPLGNSLSARLWTSPGGTKFVAAILGIYGEANRLSFKEIGVNLLPSVEALIELRTGPRDLWIALAFDPREVEPLWIGSILESTSVEVRLQKTSHNAALHEHELIVVDLLYIDIVGPFLKGFATELGKSVASDVHASIHRFIGFLLSKLDETKNPIVELQAHHEDCTFSFMFRGTDVKRHYKAYGELARAGSQAQALYQNMRRQGYIAKRLVYEYESETWFPSFAELETGKIITDNNTLIALEQLPANLSLGFAIEAKKL